MVMEPLTGIMFVNLYNFIPELSFLNDNHLIQADYHILRRRLIKLSHLFLPQAESDYWCATPSRFV